MKLMKSKTKMTKNQLNEEIGKFFGLTKIEEFDIVNGDGISSSYWEFNGKKVDLPDYISVLMMDYDKVLR